MLLSIPPIILQAIVFAIAFTVSACVIDFLTSAETRARENYGFTVFVVATVVGCIVLFMVFLWQS
jgi:hypothetical protein